MNLSSVDFGLGRVNPKVKRRFRTFDAVAWRKANAGDLVDADEHHQIRHPGNFTMQDASDVERGARKVGVEAARLAMGKLPTKTAFPSRWIVKVPWVPGPASKLTAICCQATGLLGSVAMATVQFPGTSSFQILRRIQSRLS